MMARTSLLLSLVLSLIGIAMASPTLLHESPSDLPWSHVAQWTFENGAYDGNPFDLEATAVFTHEESRDVVRTGLFYAGDRRWSVRLPAVRLGTWSFETESEHPGLDGSTGTVTVTRGPDDAMGFLRADGTKLVAPTNDGKDETAILYNVYQTDEDAFSHVGDLPAEPDARAERIDELLDEAAQYGLPALFVGVFHNWFDFGSSDAGDHDSRDPDPRTFEALEALILRAHERGMFVHLWAWGDESRGLTPHGVGGINGEADRRLQRYITARLGPLPGWTMSYGFDLEEWVEPDQVRSWGSYLQERTPWPMVLMARELGTDEGYTFRLDGSDGEESERLAVYSTDDRPTADFYELARERLAEGRPVLFERRFLHGRDGVWDADTTLRALWQFTMAGGAGAVWGVPFDGAEPYPNPEHFQIHARFWEDRWLPSLRPLERTVQGHGLRTEEGDRFVLYFEEAERLALSLDELDGPRRAVAIDLRGAEYEEVEIGDVEPGVLQWHAPRRSDWVVSVGDR